MSDEYAPALTDTANDADGAESAPVERAPAADQPVVSAGATGDDPSKPPGGVEPRGPRVISDKVRSMFKAIAAKNAAAAADDAPSGADDLVPMVSETKAPPAPPTEQAAAAAPPPAAAQPAPASTPPPVPPPAAPIVDIAKSAEAARALAAEQRDRAMAEREKAIAEREKALPDPSRLAERPGATVVEMLQTQLGINGDELKTAIADLVTELSESALGVKLPEETKTAMAARQAMRTVKAYQATAAREKAELAAQREAQAAAEREAREAAQRAETERHVAAQLDTMIAPIKSQFPFLTDPDVTGGASASAIIIDVWKAQNADHQAGKGPPPQTWQDIAKAAENYFRTQAEQTAQKAARLQKLLTPTPPAPVAAPAPAAKPQASPGGAPGPAPTQPKATKTVLVNDGTPTDDGNGPVTVDWRDQRRARLRASARAFASAARGATD